MTSYSSSSISQNLGRNTHCGGTHLENYPIRNCGDSSDNPYFNKLWVILMHTKVEEPGLGMITLELSRIRRWVNSGSQRLRGWAELLLLSSAPCIVLRSVPLANRSEWVRCAAASLIDRPAKSLPDCVAFPLERPGGETWTTSVLGSLSGIRLLYIHSL